MPVLPAAVTLFLAEETNRGPDFGKASPVGLLIVVLLLLALFGLIWSMNRQLKKVPESFDPPEADTPPDAGPRESGG